MKPTSARASTSAKAAADKMVGKQLPGVLAALAVMLAGFWLADQIGHAILAAQGLTARRGDATLGIGGAIAARSQSTLTQSAPNRAAVAKTARGLGAASMRANGRAARLARSLS